MHRSFHSIVPPYLLSRLATLDSPELSDVASAARRALVADAPFRSARLSISLDSQSNFVVELERDTPRRTVSDARGQEVLPGWPVRTEGDDPTGDVAVDEAYDGLGATHDLLREAFGRYSIDGRGMPLVATVHYGERYDNAFWNGDRMVFGDGDGLVFGRFTASVSVIGHELAHGVVQHTANLEYRGQSGALNESFSDVVGALVEQHLARHSVAEASWLIGAGLFTERIAGMALRSMAAPGTAYDDELLGRDPQPAHMDDFIDTTDDYGGVHLNSGIPNRAFHSLAMALGGFAWERAGLIWFDAITSPMPTDADFGRFAAITAQCAAQRYGDSSSEHSAVLEAWSTVGVRPDGTD